MKNSELPLAGEDLIKEAAGKGFGVVQTRAGEPVQIYAVDSALEQEPVLGRIVGERALNRWWGAGAYDCSGIPGHFDLVAVPKTYTIYVFEKNGALYTAFSAGAYLGCEVVAKTTVTIGEGLD